MNYILKWSWNRFGIGVIMFGIVWGIALFILKNLVHMPEAQMSLAMPTAIVASILTLIISSIEINEKKRRVGEQK